MTHWCACRMFPKQYRSRTCGRAECVARQQASLGADAVDELIPFESGEEEPIGNPGASDMRWDALERETFG